MRRMIFTVIAILVVGAAARAGLPLGWTTADVDTGVTGGTTYSGGTFTVSGGGDTFYTADEFHFCYQTITGDCEITARLTGETLAAGNGKAGVMIRESLSGTSQYAGIAFIQNAAGPRQRSLYRDGGAVTFNPLSVIAQDHWFRVTRVGDVLTMSYSPNGTAWTDDDQATIAMGDPVLVGMFISSYEGTTTRTASFDNVTITYPPDAFTLGTPSNGAVDQAVTPTLTWGTSTDATSYSLLVDNNANLGSPVIDVTNILTTTYAVNPGDLAVDTLYYWRVTASYGPFDVDCDSDFNFRTSANSTPGAFTLTSPADAAPDQPLSFALGWTAASNATTYALRVADNMGFASPVIDELSLGTNSYTIGAGILSYGTTYYWQVSATNAYGTVQASNNDFSFDTVLGPAPEAFALVTPNDGATDQYLMTVLDWTDSPYATSYDVQVADNASFLLPIVDVTGHTESTYTVGTGLLAQNTPYFWRVTAVNATDTEDASNNDFTYTTALGPLPGAFALLTPADAAVDVTIPFALDWEDAANVHTYTLEIDDDVGFGSPEVTVAGVASSSYVIPIGTLQTFTDYNWRVTAVNAIGNVAASNNDFTLTTGDELALGYLGEGCGAIPRGALGVWILLGVVAAWGVVARKR